MAYCFRANNRIDAIKQEKDKERVMMEASIKRLELECKSWHSKFLDKASFLDISNETTYPFLIAVR